MMYRFAGRYPAEGSKALEEARMNSKRILSFLLALFLLIGTGESALAAAKKSSASSVKVLYKGIITRRYAKSETTVYKSASKNSDKIKFLKPGASIDITAIDPHWVQIKIDGRLGYVLRNRIDVLRAVNTTTTPPYPVMEQFYYVLIDRDVEVKSAKKASSTTLTTLTKGARISLTGMEDGWAKLIWKRQWGYIDTRYLTEIYPIASNIESADSSEPIAVFTSYYNDNPDRINNLRVACKYISKTIKPGGSMNFNETVGPFNKQNGYKSAPVLKDGETTLSYGGGSCQVSSTLWDTLMQLPGITVLMRKPHGNNAAAYLPHGMDASSGATNLNFIFRNDYDFPIRIDASTHDFALFVAVYKGS